MFKVPEKFRLSPADDPKYGSDERYGNNGAFYIKSLKLRRPVFCIASDRMGWEHVSVTVQGVERAPFWHEMCFVKQLFWDRDDAVVQYHPAESEYVNCHPYCLHLWRPVGVEFPIPDRRLV